MPELSKAALDKADACMMITTGSFTHTKGRAEATERGCRIASMPGITEEIVRTTLGADYDEVARIGDILAEKLTRAEKSTYYHEKGHRPDSLLRRPRRDCRYRKADRKGRFRKSSGRGSYGSTD